MFVIFLSQVNQEAKTQVIPDTTLGSENSTVNSITELRSRIEGGAMRGENLFHSFQKFDIGEGLEVYFANPENIGNIFSRVTGNNISEIFGTLGVEGNANLFLVNPNGILFGENARLDIGGSFIATTANEIDFGEGKIFKIRDKEPLLTSKVPVGLGLDGNNGSIAVNGNGHRLTFADPSSTIESAILGAGASQNGLKISPDRTLALIGGQISIDGGVLTSPSGNIEISSIEQGTVKLDLTGANISFYYDEVNTWKDTYLDNYALLDASGILNANSNFAGGGIINLHSKNLRIDNGAFIFITNLGKTPTSRIEIDATESVTFKGISSPVTFGQGRQEIIRGLNTRNYSSTQGINVSISAKNLILQDSSIIANDTYSEGPGGDIDIAVQNKILVSGSSPIPFTFSFIGTNSQGSGTAGDVNLSGKFLALQNGGLIISQAFSTGNSGDIKVSFSDEINIEGGTIFDSNPFDNINTPNTTLISTLGTTAIDSGTSGDVTVKTEKLRLINGGRINSTASFLGKAGDIIINSNNLIEIQGRFLGLNNSNLSRSQIISSAEQTDPGLVNLFKIPQDLQAESGSVIINTDELNIQNEGLISVINQGTGDAENIEINASNISLDNQGEIAASTFSGNGGNITLNTEQLRIKNNSLISTSAGGEGNGGNIEINADSVLALNNSDITATAVRGDGGNITITTNAILGIEERPTNDTTSDIDASSEFGQDGTVTITNPQVLIQDPVIAIRGIDISEPEEEIKSKCWNDNRNDQKLVYTGRSGLSSEPDDFSDDEQYFPAPERATSPEKESEDENFSVWKEGDPLIEPNTIRVDKNGEIYFVAELSPGSAKSLLCNAEELEEEEKAHN